MSIRLRKGALELHIYEPTEAYLASRFDWTGKIVSLRYDGLELLSFESPEDPQGLSSGAGLYNEFGIDAALGFEEAQEGEWFHKIGIGLLQKEGGAYHFLKAYKIRPAQFKQEAGEDWLRLICQSERALSYAYTLTKTIRLHDKGFDIEYELKNQGSKTIISDEYVHNFLGFNQRPLDPSYQLDFNFNLDQTNFGEYLNPHERIQFEASTLGFQKALEDEFFISHLSGQQAKIASWQLKHRDLGISLKEIGDFESTKVNLWGKAHVISPELFCPIHVLPGATQSWKRQYRIEKHDMASS